MYVYDRTSMYNILRNIPVLPVVDLSFPQGIICDTVVQFKRTRRGRRGGVANRERREKRLNHESNKRNSDMESKNGTPKNAPVSAKSCLKIGTWNIRTLLPGSNTQLTKLTDVRRTAVIDMELARLNLDIVALQETRFPESGSLREKNYTFFWQGKAATERREYGVGFAICNSLVQHIEHHLAGSERIAKLSLRTESGLLHMISAYGPTQAGSEESKNQFFEELTNVFNSIASCDHMVLMGDFNSRVGNDHSSWPDCMGHFGV